MREAQASPYRAGTVAILGRPNVGKSTLLNRLIGQKLSIVSRKPQTTRQPILGVLHLPNGQIGFIDTPGLENRRSRALARAMNREALRCLADVDAAALVLEALRFDAEDAVVATAIMESGRPWVCAVNKVDLIKEKPRLLPYLAALGQRFPGIEIIPLSAQEGGQVDALTQALLASLPEGEPIYEEDTLTDRSVRFIAAEFIREKLFRRLGQELPYSLAVSIDTFDEAAERVHIAATIWVERASQKAIVIGEQGSVLKAVGSEARIDLERLLEQPVFLETWVKVREDWTEDARALRELGFDL